MTRLPVHPRLARMLVAAADESEQVLACQLAVVLESPQWFRSGQGDTVSDSDLLDHLEQWQPHRKKIFVAHFTVGRSKLSSVVPPFGLFANHRPESG